jgi:formiminotetrahydrofolate cyclodeaminase
MTIGKIAGTPLARFIEELGSGQIAPGAGSAVGIVLALAAGCAHKALAISHKHRPPTDVGLTALQQLAGIINESFESADRDDACFTAFLHQHDRPSAEQLLQADQQTRQLAERLQGVLQAITNEVLPIASGDLVSAGTLLRAAASIQAEIAKENARATKKVLGAS